MYICNIIQYNTICNSNINVWLFSKKKLVFLLRELMELTCVMLQDSIALKPRTKATATSGSGNTTVLLIE